MKIKSIKSFLKKNFSLNVIGKNKNNFHKIQSIYSFLKHHDEIQIQPIAKKKHTVIFIGPFSRGLENNSIKLLLNILDKKKLLTKKYKIKVTKNIPQKSGLGGGSMNAASILSYFLREKIINLSKKDVLSICSKIGSDVSLGLEIKNSILKKNNSIRRFNIKLGLHALLVKPNRGCMTKKIYQEVKSFTKKRINLSKNLFSIESLKNEQNDLEKPAFKIYPTLSKIKTYLSKIEQVKFVRMTGSGSTIVAYFTNKKAAINALKLTKKNFKNYWSILSKTI